MLLELRIENLGIIEEVHLLVGPGLTAISGETGAGKTLVTGALALLGGERADTTMVRDGATEARVEGRFEDASGDEVVLTRVVPREGRSRAYVDGRIATATELASRGVELLDLHAQHAYVALLAPVAQRRILDAFAGAPAARALAAYRAVRDELTTIHAELDALGGDARMQAREIALLEFQVAEIDAAELTDADEDARLDDEEQRLADAVGIRESLRTAHGAVEGQAVDALGAAIAALGGRPPLAPLETRLRGLQADASDIAHELLAAHDAAADDPERLDALRIRRQLFRDLGRKYGADLAEVIAFRAEAATRLEALRGHDERVAELEAAREGAGTRLDRAAAELRAVRTAAAEPFASAVTAELAALAMPGAWIGVEVTATDPGEDGADDVTMLLAANPGEPPAPLAKVASGGELARALLAVRVATAMRGRQRDGADRTDPGGRMLVFDEVDAGIGGEAGAAVGRALAELSRDAQVLCVTHLAQVAACARTQVVVRKGDRAGRTVAQAEVVGGEQRVTELSRMLAGVESSDHARRHAEELLGRAGAGRGTHMTRRATRPAHPRVAVEAVARVDRRTKDLTKRMQLGEIAVINHADIDRVAAEGLIGAGVGAVLNAAPSITGRYPNGGPIRLVEAGILLVDDLGPTVMDIAEGQIIHVEPDGVVSSTLNEIARGRVRGVEDVTQAMEDARANIGEELERFAENTLEYIRQEAKITFEPLELPPLGVKFKGRHAMVVVRGHDYQTDLKALKPYLREYEPVLIGVDGGADALLDLGFTPHIIIGDFDSLSDGAVKCGAQLLHHVHPDGRAPGRENLEAMGFTPGEEYLEFVAEGMSEDVAMLLAYEAGASLIVAVGTHSTMVEMLDKGRRGMSSTFLTRLRLGPVLVDAKGVHRLYEGRVRRRDILVLVLAALLTIIVIGLVAQPIHTYVDGFRLTLDDLWYSITH